MRLNRRTSEIEDLMEHKEMGKRGKNVNLTTVQENIQPGFHPSERKSKLEGQETGGECTVYN